MKPTGVPGSLLPCLAKSKRNFVLGQAILKVHEFFLFHGQVLNIPPDSVFEVICLQRPTDRVSTRDDGHSIVYSILYSQVLSIG